MKHIMGSFVIAVSMYSRIPMPRIAWTKERMRYALCFFPVVGLVIGACLVGGVWLFEHILPWEQYPIFYVCMGTALPLLITGGIHMDGFLDVTDARSSYGDRDKKLEILKDPHTGAFAILGCGVYLFLYAACFSLLSVRGLRLFAVSFVMTRALSGLSVVCFPKAKNTGLVAAFSDQAQKRVVCVGMVVWLLLCAFWIMRFFGFLEVFVCILASGCVFWYYYRMARKEFGGITGDLAGYFLQICELTMLAVIAGMVHILW